MLSAQYNLLTLKGLEPSNTYLDMLPTDLVWYMLGYTGPQDGHVVLKSTRSLYGVARDIKIVKATTLASEESLNKKYVNNQGNQAFNLYYNRTNYDVVPVKFIFIDGKQYAAIPIKNKIEGYTPAKDSGYVKVNSWRCLGRNSSGSRCKKKTKNATKLCPVHNNINE